MIFNEHIDGAKVNLRFHTWQLFHNRLNKKLDNI